MLTDEQKVAHDKIMDWFGSLVKPRQFMTLGGYAGTGKTTLISQLAATLKVNGKRLAFCTVSGKASTVLKQKLTEIINEQDYCGTIHSLIYQLIGKEKMRNGRTELYFQANEGAHLPYDLIIVDEASMVNEWMFRDLCSYGIPILAVGDHGQLPPVKGNFNLMAQPEIRLETIMRQAEGNPIIKMALMAREEGAIKYGDYGHGCIKTKDVKYLHAHQYGDINSIMLCGMNKTRTRMNIFARDLLKRQGPHPIVEEPVICLYNNNRKMIYNGNIGVLQSVEAKKIDEADVLDVEIDMGDFIFRNNIDPLQFGKDYVSVDEKDDDLDYFDYAYCITCHKSQGSEWKNVLVIEEGEFMWKGDLWRRWLYTAVTRAKEKIVIFKR